MELPLRQENSLDFLSRLLQSIDVRDLSEIEELMLDQLKTESARLRDYFQRERELRSAFEEYRRIREDAKTTVQRASQLVALLGADRLKKLTGVDPVILKQAQESTTRVALWVAIAMILEQVPELQIVDLHKELRRLGFKASRQAVESAIGYHQETFNLVSRDRDKFVSLKGIGDAPSTKQ